MRNIFNAQKTYFLQKSLSLARLCDHLFHFVYIQAHGCLANHIFSAIERFYHPFAVLIIAEANVDQICRRTDGSDLF